MKKNGCKRWGLWGGLLGMALLCIIGISLFYFQARAKAFNSRPLVLIHSPINHDVVMTGDGVLVHATARENNGLKRIELWADDQLLAARDAPHKVTSLTLTGTWVSSQAGSHAIVARAISWDGVEGQATVVVRTELSGGAQPTHVMQEGETAESIAADYGVSLEDFATANPDLGSVAPGDELFIPEGGSSPAEEEMPGEVGGPPAGGGEPPSEEAEAPGSVNLLLRAYAFIFPEENGAPTTLRIEVTRLQTSQSFDSLHCYVGMAELTPQWFPDADEDQTTDESFAPLHGGLWDVEPYLAGEAAPVVTWPNNRPLPLNISCVGIAGGGTDAVELGRMELSIPRENWDGVRRTESADGEGGHIELEYVVTRDDPPHGIPIILDPNMTVPSNVRLDEDDHLLLWDYVPREREDTINGFHIYLNGNLQWSVPPEARETGLPEEWFQIPCGMTYTYEVEAYRLVAEEPYSYESGRGEVELHQETEDCTRTVQVIFTTLETFYLGNDGDHEERTGDVGPPYGGFFANEGMILFDGGPLPELGQGVLGIASGFEHYQTYDLDSSAFVYSFDIHSSHLDVEIPYGGTLQVGFSIMNRNSGYCGRAHRRGCDIPICAATSDLYFDSPDMQNFYTWQEGTLMSSDGRCRLSYRFGPRYDSTTFSPHNPGGVGLPQMDAGRIIILGETGGLQVGVRNTGTADWTAHDLVMDLQTRDGTHITRSTVEDFALETGVWRFIDFPAGTLSAPFDACVVIDPDNLVREEIDNAGGHQPVCAELPDLAITYMEYANEDQTRLRVLVENVGEGDLVDRTFRLQLFTPGGRSLNSQTILRDVSLDPGEAEYFEMDIVIIDRDELADGFEIVVDSDMQVLESDEGNNGYFIPYLRETDD